MTLPRGPSRGWSGHRYEAVCDEEDDPSDPPRYHSAIDAAEGAPRRGGSLAGVCSRRRPLLAIVAPGLLLTAAVAGAWLRGRGRTTRVASPADLRSAGPVVHGLALQRCAVESGAELLVTGERTWSSPMDNVSEPELCCGVCGEVSGCQAWTWRPPGRCSIAGGGTALARRPQAGAVAGLGRAAPASGAGAPNASAAGPAAAAAGGSPAPDATAATSPRRGEPGCPAEGPLRGLWPPASGGPEEAVRVLSYNLLGGGLVRERHTEEGAPPQLLRGAWQAEPFDLLGFQECEDPSSLLEPSGQLDQYTMLQGPHKLAMAFRRQRWLLLDTGDRVVAEDLATTRPRPRNRSAQWMRVRHSPTGRVVFFVNHHGPLPVDSGGACGGNATAAQLLSLVAEHATLGDALIVVGDFSATASSETIRALETRMHRLPDGASSGGVDHVFSNARRALVVGTSSLGSGGSGRDALSLVLQLGGERSRL